MDDTSIWKQLAAWAWALLVPLGMAVRKRDLEKFDEHAGRLDKLAESVNSKADKEEVARHRGHIEKLYERDGMTNDRVASGFAEIKDVISKNHVELLREISKKADRS